jgi:urea transport system permease protein
MRITGLLLCGWLLTASCAQAAIDPELLKPLADDDSEIPHRGHRGAGRGGAGRGAAGAEGDRRQRAGARRRAPGHAGRRRVACFDAASNRELTPPPAGVETIGINNRVRRELAAALAALRLFSAERAVRWQAAQEVNQNADAKMLPLLEQAHWRAEKDPQIRERLQLAHAQASLGVDRRRRPPGRGAHARREQRSARPPAPDPLTEKQGDTWIEPDSAVRAAAGTSIRAIEQRLAWADNLGRAFTGLSLGSILLLAALGLAITYGVMGVINMAHGELLMVGAYSAWAMQSVFRAYLPAAIDWYLLAAIPVGFLSAALVGVLMERIVIRHLYGRPLETLLATWGISLFLMQVARTLFGAQNVEVANPSWMAGGIELLPNLMLPWNRIIIVGFSIAVLAAMWAILNLSRLGMFVRAVTQNRPMAGCVGVPTGRVDTLAFGLGAGIAGLGGVALSQIANVGPDMGQGYIVDSFMVVVLGGVGQLAGAVWAALGLGVFTKFLEGWTGAVVAKIVVLVFIIVFIQKRPQGLFALKGRFVES